MPFLNPATARQQIALGCDPNVLKTQKTPDPKCLAPIGGFTQWEASMEVRFDLSGAFGAALFCDAADVSAEEWDFRFAYLHLACGAGARYDTPVGPIRLDIGYRIPPLQVLGYKNDPEAVVQPTIFGAPIAISFGIGESF